MPFYGLGGELFIRASREPRGDSIETSDPLEDLEGAVIGGKQFSLDNYTWDLNGVPQLIYFAEVGYSMWTDNREDYALYAYIYNPAGLFFDEGSESNKIELAFGSGGYEKYPLEMIGKSQRPGYEGLFYKAEIVLSRSQREEAFGNLSSNERVYTITSMELSAGGALEDYPVGFDTDTQKAPFTDTPATPSATVRRRPRKVDRLHGGRIQRSSGFSKSSRRSTVRRAIITTASSRSSTAAGLPFRTNISNGSANFQKSNTSGTSM